jgi:integrase
MAYAEQMTNGPDAWRARYKRPDGTLGSRAGFSSRKAAEDWGNEQEALIRRHMWVDPRDAETSFGDLSAKWFDAISPRLAESTVAKYRSHLTKQLLPQWETWPLIGIFNGYIEIEKWVSELHEDYSEPTVASIFATFSTIMTASVRARMIPANPCHGVRVTSGSYETERLVATPVQGLRAAMRLYEMGAGLSGFVLCLIDLYTGGRWSELIGQQRHEYDSTQRAISIKEPLTEVAGILRKGGKTIGQTEAEAAGVTMAPESTRRRGKNRGRTKTPAGTRVVDLPPSIATFYELLLASHSHPFAFVSSEGRPLRRSNFRQRYWRPAWDGVNPEDPYAEDHIPAVLPWFTFHEGRHTQATWLAEDGIPEVARRARLGQKMKGIARTYDHVTQEMRRQVKEVLERRWRCSLAALSAAERAQLTQWFPHLDSVVSSGHCAPTSKINSFLAPYDLENADRPGSKDRNRAV